MEADNLVKIAITPGKVIDTETLLVPLLVSLQVTPELKRQPCNLCCVIDVSGSMGLEAEVQGVDAESEDFRFSLLDIAKHGLRTVANVLSASDQLSLVSFSHESICVLPPTKMDEKGKSVAVKAIDRLVADGGTDIWNGLFVGMEALRKAKDGSRLDHLMLLTDGEHRDGPKAWEILPKLAEYKNKYERLPCTINTFGFGYQVDSKLLVKLAVEGDGSYSFIPDAGFIGTCFINTVSNILVTMARQVFLDLEPDCGACITDNGFTGGHPVEKVGGQFRVRLGTLQIGQAKDVMLWMKILNASEIFFVAGAQIELPGQTEPVQLQAVECAFSTMSLAGEADILKVEQHRCRCLAIDRLQEATLRAFPQLHPELIAEIRVKAEAEMKPSRIGDFEEAKVIFDGLLEEISKSSALDMESADTAGFSVRCLLEDLRGECATAFSRHDWYGKWGWLYLPSLMFAHRLQQCNNFKDPGVQGYGGVLFHELQDEADELFSKIPPPKSTLKVFRPLLPTQTNRGHTASSTSTANTDAGYSGNASLPPAPTQPTRVPASAPAPTGMAVFNDRYGG